ncbi:MAG: thiamine ABC transporter substrate-binding protein, partial [Aestuariivirga sp.]
MTRIFASLIALLVFAPFAAAKETLTIYTYESFVSEWGP